MKSVVAGVNTFECEACRTLYGQRAHGRSSFFGTVFITVTMEKLAKLKIHTESVTGTCHIHNHINTFTVHGGNTHGMVSWPK